MKQNEKNLLLISANFPPVSTSGVHRVIRMVRYLNQMGVAVTVLTADETTLAKSFKYDKALLRKIPEGVEILRVPAFQGLKKILDFKNRAKRSAAAGADTGAARPAPVPAPAASRNKSSVRRALDTITLNLHTPDNYAFWIRPAVKAGLNAIERAGFRNILSTSPPGSAHVVAMHLKQRAGVHWLADFRDPWAKKQWFNPEMTPFRKKRVALYEQKTIALADRIIMNTPEMLQIYQQAYDGVVSRKGVVIPNGYDPEDFRDIKSAPKRENERIVIVHTGTFYRSRSPMPFLQAFIAACEKRAIIRDNFCIKFIGNVGKFAGEIQQIASAHRLHDILEIIPPIAHNECLAEMRAADVLLLLQPGTQIQVPAKLYEYIAMRKPIFAISAPGAIQRLMQEHNLGWWADAENIAQIAQQLTAIADFRQKEKGRWQPDPRALEKFNGKKLVGQMYELLR